MAGSMVHSARAYLQKMERLMPLIDCDAIDRYANLLVQAWREDRAVYVFGNGGSAACASHHVADYVQTAAVDGQRRLRAISLVDNTEILTAISNDFDYSEVFRRGLEAYARPGDLAVGISCSGNSPNVLRACGWAKLKGMATVAITGFDGGKLGRLADIHVNIPSDNYGIIEDLQLSVGHIVSQMLRAQILLRSLNSELLPDVAG